MIHFSISPAWSRISRIARVARVVLAFNNKNKEQQGTGNREWRNIATGHVIRSERLRRKAEPSEMELMSLPPSVEFLGQESFALCTSLSLLTCESESKLARIEWKALSLCSSLKSISLSASVEFLGEESFSSCESLSSFIFDSGSKLSRIESKALNCYSSLKSVCLPASIEFLGRGSFFLNATWSCRSSEMLELSGVVWWTDLCPILHRKH
jgi:hypothetical protein